MTEKKDPYDHTSSKRASALLKRLEEKQGKRLPVDLSAESLQQIADLVGAGYGNSSVAVIRKAIKDAHASLGNNVVGECNIP